MKEVIEKYYKENNVLPFIVEKKRELLDRNSDIQDEMAYWIVKKEYMAQGCVEIQGYTAQSIAELSPFMNGEGAFMLLIELRENPEKAKKRLSEGFIIK